MASLQAIFFDMGGTIDTFRFSKEQRVTEAALIRECLQRAGIHLKSGDARLADMITRGAAAYVKWNMETCVELPPAVIWSRFFLKPAGISAEALEPVAEELAFLYETRLFVRELRPDAPAVLAAIQALGLKIGMISNTQSLRQVPDNLRDYGLIHYFDPIVLSSRYGRRKPDPSIFYHAARLARVPTGSCLYVGDKINRDIVGAQRAGFRAAVQIMHPYDNGEPDEGARPDAVIQSLSDLLPVIETLLAEDRRAAPPPPTRQVKAVFFDAGDILYHRPRRGEQFNRFLSTRVLNPQPDLEAEKYRLRELAFAGQIARHSYYEQVVRLYGINDEAEVQAGVAAQRADDNSVEIFPGAPETIRALKARGFLLGIITDTAMNITRKLDWFDRYNFGNLWDVVISSKEMKARKPAPCMYEEALAQAGVSPRQAVFVGHKPAELDGARAVGMRTIALHENPGARADTHIRDIRELLDMPLLRD